jgi:hypothetical protein
MDEWQNVLWDLRQEEEMRKLRTIDRLRANRRAMVAMALIATVAGCDSAGGRVVEKEYEPARTRVVSTPVYGTECAGTGTKRKCVSKQIGTRDDRKFDPECWELDLSDGSEVCVSRQVWESVKVGDFFSE